MISSSDGCSPGSSPGTSPGSDIILDITKPHPARRYNYWLGGRDNFAADRESGDDIAARFPHIRTAARENRRFLNRVVSVLAAEHGIRRFADFGAGLPAKPYVHDIAATILPDPHVVYVDNDKHVLTHARALMNSQPPVTTAYIDGDLHTPQQILNHPDMRALLDTDEPIAALLIAVMHFITDDTQAADIIATITAALPAGSFVALSHATFDPLPPDTTQALQALSLPQAGHGPFRARTADQVAALVNGLDPVPPGLVSITDWHPERQPHPQATPTEAAFYGLLTRTPMTTIAAYRDHPSRSPDTAR